MFALTGLSPIYYDDNSYGYDDEDGNNRKDDNLEIKKQQNKNIHLSPSLRSFSN